MPVNLDFDPNKEFALFRPCSAGDLAQRSELTFKSIKQTLPNLRDLTAELGLLPQFTPIEAFAQTDDDRSAAVKLANLFNEYGSDKSSVHNYHLLYGPLLKEQSGNGVLEIGIGSNDPNIVSNMGTGHTPGGCLRAFRDFTAGQVFGADFDRDIEIVEERIATYFVDQTDPETLEVLGYSIPDDLDLVIDDGLHAPNANLATLTFGLKKIRDQGWVVVEDIGPAAVPLWQAVHAIVSRKFNCYLIKSKAAHMFAVQKVAR